jgi:hypothetical protein
MAAKPPITAYLPTVTCQRYSILIIALSPMWQSWAICAVIQAILPKVVWEDNCSYWWSHSRIVQLSPIAKESSPPNFKSWGTAEITRDLLYYNFLFLRLPLWLHLNQSSSITNDNIVMNSCKRLNDNILAILAPGCT